MFIESWGISKSYNKACMKMQAFYFGSNESYKQQIANLQTFTQALIYNRI